MTKTSLRGVWTLAVAFGAIGLATGEGNAQVATTPDVAFKLATFEVDGRERAGVLLDGRLFDLQEANAYLTAEAGVASVEMPGDMKALIEASETLKPRLFQIANYLSGRTEDLTFGHSLDDVLIRAPIKYPWNLIAAGQNYRDHAAEVGGSTETDPDRDDPLLFAKSPRSTIIDPGQPYVIPPGRDRIDWEGEFSVVLGRRARNLTLENAMEHVFGFTILYDVSDRAAQIPEHGRFARDYFSGKSMEGASPMGPYVVPKEFLPNYAELQVTTRVNGEVMQDSNTAYLIHDVERLLRFASRIMTLWPGDVVATGTPAGVGLGRTPPVYLESGDVVEIEVEGIGTLMTPIQ